MRITMAAAAGVAVFFGTACGNGGSSSDSGNSTAAGSSTGIAPATTTGGSGTTTGAVITGTTTGTSTGSNLSPDGTACTANAACQSGICGLNGSGNCCTTACKTDDATCAATACDTKGACTYPTDGKACSSICQYGVVTPYACGGGACSATKPVTCPDAGTCNDQGTTCEGGCNPANGNSDCANGWYCSGTSCMPQIQLGACTSNAQCESNVCGVNGTGNCCTQSACTNVYSSTNLCGTQDCDGATGECTFPPSSASCDTGPITCKTDSTGTNLNVQVDPNTTCDGDGTCQPPVETACSPFACEALGCVTTCNSKSDCATDFWCNNGACVPQQAVGACTTNDACITGECGPSGTGHCCFHACPAQDPTCGINDCDSASGACVYPDTTHACGSVLESCANDVQQNPSVCDGAGNCPTPGMTDCTPFICGATACKTTCKKTSDCVSGATCAVGSGICCPALLAGDTLNVDSQLGSDTAACCGQTSYTPCGTIAHAMSLIDTAQASGVTLSLSIGGPGSGGEWSGDTYPITLGWGVELAAGGITFGTPYFYNNYNNFTFICYTGLFDIAQYSANDTTGYVSIVGSAAAGNALVGYDSANGTYGQCNNYAIQIENGQHLYLANAQVSSGNDVYYYTTYNNGYMDMAINIEPGGSLTLARDQSTSVTGQVVIGTTDTTDNYQRQGYKGIVCNTDGTADGCTIDDYNGLDAGPSVIFQNNQYDDLEANDFSTITLNGSPQFGSPPSSPGLNQCQYKIEGQNNVPYSSSASFPMVWLNGTVTMTINNALLACLDGDGFVLNPSPNSNPDPTLTVNGTTIENTDYAIYASAGTVSGKNNTIVYNYYGVVQDGTSTIDLSGGGNTVACTSGTESAWYRNDLYSIYNGFDTAPSSASVVDLNSNNLDADNVIWDTTGPDIFSCTDSNLTSCTCETSSGTCTATAGADGMDAVYDSTGSVSVSTPGTTWGGTCTAPTICLEYGSPTFCPSGDGCCNDGFDDYYCGEGC